MIVDCKESALRRPGLYCTSSHAGGRLQDSVSLSRKKENLFPGWWEELAEIQRSLELINRCSGHVEWLIYVIPAI
jgi:hypothetical protein